MENSEKIIRIKLKENLNLMDPFSRTHSVHTEQEQNNIE